MAYKGLSSLSPDPSMQGATQKVSAIRHFIALDCFFKKYQRDCDTRDGFDKNEFIKYVGLVSDVCLNLYTTNFYYPLKQHNGDYCVGSNFYSAGQVSDSLVNPSVDMIYPKRGNQPLFKIRDGKLMREVSLYSNISKHLVNTSCTAALIVWLLRKTDIQLVEGKQPSYNMRNALSKMLTKDLLSILFQDEQAINDELSKYSLAFNGNPYSICDKDIEELFDINKKDFKTVANKYRPYITAIKSKPFLLLAGISGTGKSCIVRELARACWNVDDDEYKAQKPRNFEMVQVKPNWHDSTELIGYVTRVSGNPEYVAGDFLKFVARAWEETDVPYFLCLDEMNLAPVEQYFAEYLSVVESRKKNDNGEIVTDPIIEPAYEAEYDEETGSHKLKDWYENLIKELLAQCSTDKQFALTRQFEKDGISLPPNLIVIGTVNMDETTFSFSRKVLDRAMTIEMNEVDLFGGLEDRHEHIGKLSNTELIGDAVEGVDVYTANKKVCDIALNYLQSVNNVLEGTPFKIAYRTRNEFLLYVVNNLPYNKDKDDNELSPGYIIARALDEITNMKILPRIEGDDTKVTDDLLNSLKTTIEDGLKNVMGDDSDVPSVSLKKLDEMIKRLQSGYTSYWS